MAYSGSTAAILSNYDEVLKIYYLPAIQEQLNSATILADLVDVNEKDVSGKEATIECHYGRSKGIGARADGGAMPEADYQKFKKATVPMKYNYGRITVSGPTIAATRDEKGAYARALDAEITGIVSDVQKDLNRQLWGAGYGILARWRTTGSGTSYTVQKAYTGNTAGGNGFGSTFGAKYFEEIFGGTPVVLTTSGSTVTVATVDASDVAVSAIVESATYDTITVTDPSVSEAAGTYYVRLGSALTVTAASSTAGAGRLEMMGLRGIITDQDIDEIVFYDGTDQGMSGLNDPLQGLAIATYPWWKSSVFSHASGRYAAQRALTLDLMQRVFDKVEDKAGKDYGPNLILTSKPIRREYLKIMQADRRNVNTMTLDGGWKALDYNGIPLTTDKDAIDGEMYFLSTQDLQIYRMSDYNWMNKDGSVLHMLTGYDAYEAVLFRYAEMGCTRRNSQGVLTDLAYTL